ncbi:hypothetical protein J8F10_33820 [Gemmata sp. G18]|uniref:DUF5666 domain-containing protein n=1 Tax=Gemmata palustris TaxID=2822762 RepID=A0ABS5C2M4_9BACT|nr:MJ0042-type zinc finger domain-containing protein [Gemmata palustris]MBP3960232.1 hypothetical protein [Gemmata palustris]
MPVRLVCPSCSATLSVKDEFAGRAVRCPKCGGVIPASQPGAPVPPPSRAVMPALPLPEPAPEPPPELFGVPDEPAPPKGGKIVGRPVTPVPEGDEYDEEARPARRRGPRDERNGDDRPSTRRGAAGRDDDRPVRRRRPRDDGDDDRPEGKKGGKGPIIIVAILCGTLLTCCGGAGYGGWWLYSKAKKAKDDFVEAVDKINFRVGALTYGELEVGTATRTETDAKLGTGRIATDADLPKVFAADPGRTDVWSDKVRQKRAILWQNGDDYLIAAFHPTADGNARLQAKEWHPKSGAALREGELNDVKFAQQYPPGGTSVTAEDLAQAYKDNVTTADEKYKNKTVLVEGKLNDFTYGFEGELQVILDGVPASPGRLATTVRVFVAKSDTNKVLGISRGQTAKFKGKCNGTFGGLEINIANATFDSAGADLSSTVTASTLIAEYGRGNEATDEKYKDKPITITSALIESKDGDQSLYVVGNLKKSTVRIKVTLPSDAKKQIATLKAGDRVKIKGEYSSSSDNVIYINRAWIAP